MKILIRLPNWLGDVVMSTAFVGAVNRHYPEALVDVIIKKELGGIVSLIPGLNRVHLFSKQEHPGLAGVYRFGKTLQAEKYDLFFCLPDSLSSALMGCATKAKKRIGFGKEGRFSPCRQGVETLLRLTIHTRVLGMHINVEGTPIDLGGSHVYQFQEG